MFKHAYILNDAGQPELAPDILEWARWYGTADRHVAKATIGCVEVSTIFLGLDHDYSTDGMERQLRGEPNPNRAC